MKKQRSLQLVSGLIAIIAGICELIYQFYQIKFLHVLFIIGLVVYTLLFIIYFAINRKRD